MRRLQQINGNAYVYAFLLKMRILFTAMLALIAVTEFKISRFNKCYILTFKAIAQPALTIKHNSRFFGYLLWLRISPEPRPVVSDFECIILK